MFLCEMKIWSILDYIESRKGACMVQNSQPVRVWTVSEAKARLSEVLRRSETEGPQRIGARRAFVVVPADVWYANSPQREPMGKWLVENMPRGIDLEIPERKEGDRSIPFADDSGE